MKLRSKRIIAALMSVMMVLGNTGTPSYAAETPDTRVARPGVADLTREVANEGMVLLKNDKELLPLSSEKILLYLAEHRSTHFIVVMDQEEVCNRHIKLIF